MTQCWNCFGEFGEPTYQDCLPRCPHCLSYAPGFAQIHGRPAAVHVKERAVVYENPLTGQVRYPGRADVPMPARYAEQGYVRREFETAHALGRFEKAKGVANEALNCNSGNTLDAPLQDSPADTAHHMPVTPGPDGSLTVDGVNIKLRSRNNA